MGTVKRKIELTEAEFRAILAACSLYEAEEDDFLPGDPEYAEHRRNTRLQDRVIDKWHAAK